MNHTQQTMLKKKVIHRTPFLGEERDKISANEHIEYIENERNEHTYSDIESNYLLKLTLRESAANWLEEWTNEHQEEAKHWKKTRTKFLYEFGNEKENKQQEKELQIKDEEYKKEIKIETRKEKPQKLIEKRQETQKNKEREQKAKEKFTKHWIRQIKEQMSGIKENLRDMENTMNHSKVKRRTLSER